MKMTGRMKPHAVGLTCEQGFQTGLKPDYAEMREMGQNPCNREKALVLRALGERKKGAREAEIRPLPYL